MIVFKMVQIAVITMMNTHLHEFNGVVFLQQAGGPIGLRTTCAVGRIVMNYWADCWMEPLRGQHLTSEEQDRYMDDVRVFVLALKAGWRWDNDGLYFCKAWQDEDLLVGKSPTRRTGEQMVKAMSSILYFLTFTLEIGEDFPDGKIPTLDTKIWKVSSE